MKAAVKLYVKQTGDYWSLKRGAADSKGKRPGSLRRLITVIDQFSLTYDLYGMNDDEILDLLPSEFERWRNG